LALIVNDETEKISREAKFGIFFAEAEEKLQRAHRISLEIFGVLADIRNSNLPYNYKILLLEQIR
jgi:hypothetical protein